MDNLRVVLWGGFFVLLWLGVLQWNQDYQQPAPPSRSTTQSGAADIQNENKREETQGILGLSDKLPTVTIEAGKTQTDERPTDAPILVTVKTDVVELGINPDKGGDIVEARLLQYFPS